MRFLLLIEENKIFSRLLTRLKCLIRYYYASAEYSDNSPTRNHETLIYILSKKYQLTSIYLLLYLNGLRCLTGNSANLVYKKTIFKLKMLSCRLSSNPIGPLYTQIK